MFLFCHTSLLFSFSSLTAPFLMVYNSTDQVYYLMQYSELKEDFTEEKLTVFLNAVLKGNVKVYSRVYCIHKDNQ